MPKPTYQPLDKNRTPTGAPMEYTPIVFIAGTQTHRLALHRDIASAAAPNDFRDWVVAHPGIGAIVCRVRGWYKGMPVSSRGFNTPQARAAAILSLDALCERIGSESFNARIASELENVK